MSGTVSGAPQSQTEQEQVDPTRDPVENPRVPTDMGQVESRVAAGIDTVAGPTTDKSDATLNAHLDPENVKGNRGAKFRPLTWLIAEAIEAALVEGDQHGQMGWGTANTQRLATKAQEHMFILNNLAVSFNSGGPGRNIDPNHARIHGAKACAYVAMLVDVLDGFDEPTGRS